MPSRVRADTPVVETADVTTDFLYPATGEVRKAPLSGTYTVYSKDRSMTDVVIPGFKQLSARGHIFNNAMSSQENEYYQDVVEFENRLGPTKDSEGNINESSGFHDVGTKTVGTLGDGVPFPVANVDLSRLTDIAVTQAWANVDVSNMSALVSLAEAQKSVDFMTSTFRKLKDILIKLKRLRLQELKGELSPDALADGYLAIRYGLRPLVYDVKGMIAALEAEFKFDRRTARGYASDSVGETLTTSDHQSYGSVRTDWLTTVERQVTVRAGVLYSVDTNTVISQIGNFGLDQYLEAGWELVPFSFIIGWFFNTGHFISSLTVGAGLTPLASWVTVEDHVVKTRTLTGSRPTPDQYTDQEIRGRSVNIGSGSQTWISTTKTRTPNPARYSLPRFDLNLDTLKLLDLMAICRSITR